MYVIGLLFALLAFACWGFGDFSIQRTTRSVGSMHALFYIGVFGFIVLFPFAYKDFHLLFDPVLLLLFIITAVVVFLAAWFDFEALRQGKIAIIEPIIGLELPITVGLSIVLNHEQLSGVQILLIIVIFMGVVLACSNHKLQLHYGKQLLEKGVLVAFVGALGMALTNIFIGISSQHSAPLLIIWFVHSCLVLFTLPQILLHKQFRAVINDIGNFSTNIIAEGLLDNGAWVAYAYAVTFIPISIAVPISESYIALASLLGIFVNKEKLKTHQIIGVALTLVAMITLGIVSKT